MKELSGKRGLVTGAASGIGRAIAIELAKNDVHVFLLDIDEAGLSETADQVRNCGVEVETVRCNLAEPDQITSAAQTVLDQWGKLDILVNNAGVVYQGPTERMTEDQWNWLLAINLHAPIQLVRSFLPTLLNQPESHILNICSIAGLVATRQLAAYHVSKFGLVGFSEALRAEYLHRGLGVTTMCPGFVDTQLFESGISGRPRRAVRKPSQWLTITPERVARKSVRAIRRNLGLVLVSAMAHLLWGLKRLSPWFIDWMNRVRRKKHRIQVAAPESQQLQSEVSNLKTAATARDSKSLVA